MEEVPIAVVAIVLCVANAGGGGSNGGVVFKITGTKETLLYIFESEPKDGYDRQGDLIFVKGMLYGTTLEGAAKSWPTRPVHAGKPEVCCRRVLQCTSYCA